MSPPMTTPKVLLWFNVVLTVAMSSVGMMGFGALFPLLNLWVRDLGLSHTQGGVLSGLWYLPGLVFSLPAGWMFDRYVAWRVLLPCWILMIIGTGAMAFAPGFWILCAGRLIFSMGMTGYLVGAPKQISIWFEGRKGMGLAMGLYAMSAPIGIYASLNVLGRIGDACGWREAMYVMTGVTLIGTFLLIPIASASKRETARGTAPRTRFNLFHVSRAAWLLGFGFFGYNIGTEAYLTFTPDYLVHRGYTLAAASVMVGNYAYASLLLKPVFSSFLNRVNVALFVVVASALAILSIAVLLIGGLSPNVPSIVMGVSLALGMPALYALPPFLFPPEESGKIFGMYQLFYSFGFFAQPLVGRAIDKAGGYGSGYLVMVAYCLVGLFCILPFTRRSPEDPQPVRAEAS